MQTKLRAALRCTLVLSHQAVVEYGDIHMAVNTALHAVPERWDDTANMKVFTVSRRSTSSCWLQFLAYQGMVCNLQAALWLCVVTSVPGTILLVCYNAILIVTVCTPLWIIASIQ
jgi:hypothetical protein